MLGDVYCGFDTSAVGYSLDIAVEDVERRRVFRWENFGDFDPEWFSRGRVEILDGPLQGLWGSVKHDRVDNTGRTIELWEPLRGAIEPGVSLRITAGCDKRSETCRLKFQNLSNFRGFPDLPGDDWLIAVPKSTGANTGGSLR